ncbi:dual specificity protein kinase splA-like [Adelges cooleyi]|uniref:dual specificity protein kinase splA-like n=1 Tax=Adelges cooleyi TaxID=133065 RepID=UPI00217FD44F|nr:dual specificity protein kinase splA-like [Adelges cooleyi]
MKFVCYCLVFLSAASVAVSLEVKKVYVIERDYKTGVLRARRQNVPTAHTVARIGGQTDQFHGPSLPLVAQPHPLDLASTVDLTVDRTPTDYLTPPSVDFTFQNFQSDPLKTQESQHQSVGGPHTQFVQVTSPFTPNSGPPPQQVFQGPPQPVLQGPPQPVLQGPPHLLQTSSPSNQVQSLSFASQPIEQFTPFTPTLVHDHQSQQQQQQLQQQQQQPQNGRWDLGFDANEILTPPASVGTDPLAVHNNNAVNLGEFQQESHQQQRNIKAPSFGGLFAFDGPSAPPSSSNNNKFTPQDAVVRPSSSNINNNNNNNVFWGTPKTAQQQPLRPPITFSEPNAYRFNNHNNHQFVDGFQVPFTGQFDGPLSQGTVSDHVVHTSFRIKRQLNLEDDEMDSNKQQVSTEDVKDEREYKETMPVITFVKTDKHGNFKWSVRQGY